MKNMLKNIVEVIYNWPAETFIQRHVEALISVGFPIQILARHAINLLKQNASISTESQKFSSYILPNFNHLGYAGKLSSLRYLTSKSMRVVGNISIGDRVVLGYFECLQPDLIHFHDASLAASMQWIPRLLGVPYTLSLRGSDIQVLPNQSAEQKNSTISALQNARRIHAVCDCLGGGAKKIAGSQLAPQTIYTTIPIPDKLPQWLGAKNKEELHFVSSGRLMWRKGFSQLLVAVRYLLDRGESVKLTIVGNGPEIDFILYMRNILNLESHISLVGKLNYKEFSQLLSNAHAYVQSSIAEGLSNALVEAMANGVPVFATDVDGTGEVIEDGVTGFLLPPLQPEKWADILGRARDIELMEQVRTIAYQQACERFSPEKHAKDFIHFYRQALNA